MYNKSIFIFRRDLGLIDAIKNSKSIIPIFIFTPEQIEKNKFKSDNAIQFMIESLAELSKKRKKRKKSKKIVQILEKFNTENEAKIHINNNQDIYFPYIRSKRIKKLCSLK